ncbi:MAG: Asp23/Gls24 family envelope stress response protein [Clostridiales bacterium]|nr:Asp23/Gls24 family envelope stress response protein [Clostridiales bacterium]
MGENREYISYLDEKGSINISEEVVAIIAGSTALEIEGVAGLYSTPSRDIAELLGRRNLARGVKIHLEENTISADIYIMAALGFAVNEVGASVQKAVSTAIESTTGLKVTSINVHVCGIAFKKDK